MLGYLRRLGPAHPRPAARGNIIRYQDCLLKQESVRKTPVVGNYSLSPADMNTLTHNQWLNDNVSALGKCISLLSHLEHAYVFKLLTQNYNICFSFSLPSAT